MKISGANNCLRCREKIPYRKLDAFIDDYIIQGQCIIVVCDECGHNNYFCVKVDEVKLYRNGAIYS